MIFWLQMIQIKLLMLLLATLVHKKWLQKRHLLRAVLVLLFFILTICCFYMQQNYNEPVNQFLTTHLVDEKYLINTTNCKIPNDDPFNEDVIKFYSKVKYTECSNKPILTYLERRENVVTLNVNQSLLRAYSNFDISCCYSIVTRIVIENQSDDDVKLSECVPFNRSIEIKASVVQVNCWTFYNSKLYSNVHAVITPEQVAPRKLEKTSKFGVVLIGIDSISKQNLVRTMPKTHFFLETKDFVNLRGYTKIDDNTFPNVIAILSGKTWKQVNDHCAPYKHVLNNCDIIWNNFSDLGHVTAYAEDETWIGTFNYDRKGFSVPPTDFYFRPYLKAAEDLPSRRKFGHHVCSGPENSGERVLNLAKDFIFTFEHIPKFGLFWMNSFSHDSVNHPSSMDDKVEEFLATIYSHLENTILVVFSDHGFRFGDIRYTHTGWLEERLPFIYIYLPQRFKQQHPKEAESLAINSRRLTTPFDLYMTLQNILALNNVNYTVKPSQACVKCHSLFKEINESRTCKDGAIAQHWCLCSGHSYINPNTKIAIDGANFVLSTLSNIITSSNCAPYHFSKVVFCGISEKYLNEQNESVKNMLIMVETRPPAMFEATLEVSTDETKFNLLGSISRTNRYGDNSKCVTGPIEKYCYCDDTFTSIRSAICNFFDCL